MDEINKVISLFQKEFTTKNKGFKSYPVDNQLNKIAALFTPGNNYYFILNFYDLSIDYVSPSVKSLLGIEPKNYSLQEELISRHLRQLKPEDILNYKYSYFFRARDASGKYHNILHQATTITLSEENKIGHVLDVHIDVTHLKFINDNTMSIIALKNDLKSYYRIDPDNFDFADGNGEFSFSLAENLSDREIYIINLLAQGLNTKEIAKELSISEHTVRTHRKNILQKTKCANTAELVSKCLLEGVI